MQWYLLVIRKYIEFSGRARRKEYWMFALFQVIFAVVAIIIDNLLGSTLKFGNAYESVSLPYGYVYILYAVATLLPSLGVTVRRLHDVDKSGWFILFGLIPFVGSIYLLVLYCTEGTRGPNRYGEDPKALPPDGSAPMYPNM